MRESRIPWLTVVTMMAVAAMMLEAAEGSLSAADFQHHAVLDQRGAFVMMWTPADDNIRVEVQVATMGWVGLGFSPNGGMRGADITLGWVDSRGELHVHDRYAHGMTTPVVDYSQDVVVEGGYQNSTHTVMRFSRPWNTCDTKHDFILSGDTMRVIWAYGEEDPVDEMTMERHVERGTKSMYLKEPRFIPPAATDDIKTWDIRSPNISLPSHTDTVYWCKLYKTPNLPGKVHVIGFQPLISQENLPFVHHTDLYSCTDSHVHLEKWTQHDGVQCFSPDMPPSWSSCTTMVVAWSVGNEGEMWPEHVGIPLGEDSDTSYFVMQTHYNNPRLVQGIVDDSGLRIFYTEKLRKYDAGILTVGHRVNTRMVIPPRQTWKTIGHCSGRCTEETIPSGGVKVFQVVLHSHLLGRGLKVRQIRGHRELPILSQDLHYDFNYQQGRRLPKEVTVLPGDSFIVECQYDARDETIPTFGGYSTYEEMCLAFMMYYPKMSLQECYSYPMLENIYRPLGVQSIHNPITRNGSTGPLAFDEEQESELAAAFLERKEKPVVKDTDFGAIFQKMGVLEPASLKNKTLYDILYDEETWRDERKVKELQKQIESNPHQTTCRLESGELSKHTYKYPHFIPINTLDDECSETHESQAYLPEHPDISHGNDILSDLLKTEILVPVTEMQGPPSLALRPTLTLSCLLSPLILLIHFHQ